MAAKQKFFVYQVEGRGLFPFDMLRYDRAYPNQETDAGRIEASTRRGFTAKQTITLEGLKEPTVGRWESFGWKVGTMRERRVD